MKRKCPKCGEVKFIKDFSKHKNKKDGLQLYCKACFSKLDAKYKSTELGYLKEGYRNIRYKRGPKCCFTVEEFFAAWEKHKSIYGMRSGWGPGIDHLEQHLPITMIHKGEGQVGKKGCLKGAKRTGSNLSVDRLDSSKPYTIQNIIFIRSDENARKKDTSYEDCKIQIRLHEERFINMEAI
jgi:hypothetical protein